MLQYNLIITAGAFACVALTTTSLYYILTRFRPAAHQFPPPSPPSPKSTPGDLKKVLSTIPVTDHSNSEGVRECCVCLSSVEEGEKVRILPDCGHGYHAACIDAWLFSQLSCPFCRSPVKALAKSSVAKPEEVESLSASRTPLSIKMAFWRNRSWRRSSSYDDGSNGGAESGLESEESSPV